MLKIKKMIFVYLLLFVGCANSSPKTFNDGFPDIWWQEVPKDQLPGWEIPPQAADRSKSEVVLSKRNELGKFSNLEPAPFILDGENYASVEGLWQSMKYPENKDDERFKDKSIVWPYTRKEVMKLSNFEAKKAGDLANENMKKLGIKWVTYKGNRMEYFDKDKDPHYEIILRASRAKLENNPAIKELLLRTKNLKLLADHVPKTGAPPAYKYNEISMKLRAEFQKSM